MKTHACIAIILCGSLVNAADYEGNAAEHIADGVFTCPTTGLTFKAPTLNADQLRVQHRETTPGITWDLMFVEELGHVATVTYTRIRDEYPKSDEVIQRTASKIKQESLQQGGYLEWCGFLSNEEGRVLQCVIRMPGRGHPAQVRNTWLDRLEQVQLDIYCIRQYIVRDGWFLEFNIYIPQMLPTGSFDEDKLLDQWFPSLNDLVSGSSLVGKEGRYSAQIQAFKRPKSYFRYIFTDPARG